MDLREIRFETAKPALDLAKIVFHAIELPSHMTQMIKGKIFNLPHHFFFPNGLRPLHRPPPRPGSFAPPRPGNFGGSAGFGPGLTCAGCPGGGPTCPWPTCRCKAASGSA